MTKILLVDDNKFLRLATKRELVFNAQPTPHGLTPCSLQARGVGPLGIAGNSRLNTLYPLTGLEGRAVCPRLQPFRADAAENKSLTNGNSRHLCGVYVE